MLKEIEGCKMKIADVGQKTQQVEVIGVDTS